MRTSQLYTRFETARFIGKTLLCGKDVPSDFLLQKSAGKLKALCGNDRITAEIKGSSECIDLRGRFNIIIVANAHLRVSTDSDLEAWRRRIIWIRFDQPPVKNRIPDFDKLLLAEEGPGILNWMLEGAAEVLSNAPMKTMTSEQRVDELLRESDSVSSFLKECVCKVDKAGEITSVELYNQYEYWCNREGIAPLPQQNAMSALRTSVEELFQVKQSHDLKRGIYKIRGYHSLQFVNIPGTVPSLNTTTDEVEQ